MIRFSTPITLHHGYSPGHHREFDLVFTKYIQGYPLWIWKTNILMMKLACN